MPRALRTVAKRALTRVSALVAGLALVACDGASSRPTSGASVAVQLAPLSLPGLTDVEATLTVTNDDGATVWTRTLNAARYGDGTGFSYVGPCDAASDVQPNHVALTIDTLHGPGGVPLTAAEWRDPTADAPLTRDVVCLPDADVPVVFDVTVARPAQQGFFDVAVSFGDVFCSAKVDCEDDAGDALELVHGAGGARLPSYVVAIACTTGDDGGAINLYLTDVTVQCDGATAAIPVELGPGNLYSSGSPAPDPLEQAVVFAGESQLDGGADLPWLYLNVAFALASDAAGPCALSLSATATSSPLDDFVLVADYPYIDVVAPLLDGDEVRVCSQHPLDDGDGVVTTRYASAAAPVDFALSAVATAPGVTFARSVAHASCADIADAGLSHGDGVYSIDPDGAGPDPAFDVYCLMSADPPREYLELPAQGAGTNYAHYDGAVSPNGCGTISNSGGGATTVYTKVRLDPATLAVSAGDQTFATSTGLTTTKLCASGALVLYDTVSFGAAMACYNDYSARGDANIDLTGTPFVISTSSTVGTNGWHGAGTVSYASGRKIANLTGGGFCGGYRFTSLVLDFE